jgi:hypothetical protein
VRAPPCDRSGKRGRRESGGRLVRRHHDRTEKPTTAASIGVGASDDRLARRRPARHHRREGQNPEASLDRRKHRPPSPVTLAELNFDQETTNAIRARALSVAASLIAGIAVPETPAAPAPPIGIVVRQVVSGEKFAGYVGDGPATALRKGRSSARRWFPTSSSRGADGKPSSYVAKDITTDVKGAMLLGVRVEVTNGSDKDQPFDLLDLGLRGKGVKTIGLGEGPVAFVKDAKGLKLVKKVGKPSQLPPGKPTMFTYIFEVPKGSSTWNSPTRGRTSPI